VKSTEHDRWKRELPLYSCFVSSTRKDNPRGRSHQWKGSLSTRPRPSNLLECDGRIMTRYDAPGTSTESTLSVREPAKRKSVGTLPCAALVESPSSRLRRRHLHLNRPMARLLGDEKMAFILSLGHIVAANIIWPATCQSATTSKTCSKQHPESALTARTRQCYQSEPIFGCYSSRGACAAHACKTSLQNRCR
jgi:hypothetical protein